MIADVIAVAVSFAQHVAAATPNPDPAEVEVPTVDATILPQIQTWVTIIASFLGGGGVTVGLGGPIIAARLRKVRQFSDVREDTTVEIDGLKAASAEWRSIAADNREQAKAALADLRSVLTDKDKQITDQRLIIDDLRGIIRLRDETIADLRAGRDVEVQRSTELNSRLLAAEQRERDLIRTRDEIATRLEDSERRMAETTLDPTKLRELRQLETGTHSTHDRHGMKPLN